MALQSVITIRNKVSTSVNSGQSFPARVGHDDHSSLRNLVGHCPAMQEVCRLTRRVALTSATVLITGETGTGKELIARAIYETSARSIGPFIRVNCGALNENLLESELFGHVKGAFTGANETRTGRFEAAHRGTIFLDEVNSMSLAMQAKLLRVLQEREFERVGDTNTIQVDCRIITATNCDLFEEVKAKRFREDLYYRLNVVPIHLPPLRERLADVEPLVLFFARKYAMENNRAMPRVEADVMTMLQDYLWPGNVRELQNYLERAVILMTTDSLTTDLFPKAMREQSSTTVDCVFPERIQRICSELVTESLLEVGKQTQDIRERIVSLVERETLRQVLELCRWTQAKAAVRLGINRVTLHRKIKEYHLQSDDN